MLCPWEERGAGWMGIVLLVSLHVLMTDIQIPGTPTAHRMRLSLSCSKYMYIYILPQDKAGVMIYCICPAPSTPTHNSLGLGYTQLGFMDMFLVLVWIVEG